MFYYLMSKILRKQKKKIIVDLPNDTDISPVDTWAFIRVKNEMTTLPACLNSILPVINKGVIAFHDSNEQEENFILNFCQQNTGFIPFKYPHHVIPPYSLDYLTNTDKKHHLDSYYNAVLALIPDNAWLLKVDADHIYDTQRLARFLSIPKHDTDVVFMSRVNLHMVNNQIRLLNAPPEWSPFLDPADHWLIKKRPDMQFNMVIKNEKDSFIAYEMLNLRYLRKKIWITIYSYRFGNLAFPIIEKLASSNRAAFIYPHGRICQRIGYQKTAY